MIKRLEAVEMWFLRRMMRIPWTARVSNEMVLRRAGVEKLVSVPSPTDHQMSIGAKGSKELAPGGAIQATSKRPSPNARDRWVLRVIHSSDSHGN